MYVHHARLNVRPRLLAYQFGLFKRYRVSCRGSRRRRGVEQVCAQSDALRLGVVNAAQPFQTEHTFRVCVGRRFVDIDMDIIIYYL